MTGSDSAFRFSRKLAKKRLRAAQTYASDLRTASEAFCGLAFKSCPEDPDTALRTLVTWPVEAYTRLDPQTRIQILRWLIAHADEVERLDRTHGWTEQWTLALLSLEPTDEPETLRIAKALSTRPASHHADALFDALEARHDSPKLTLHRARHLQHNARWTALIALAERRLPDLDGDRRRRLLRMMIDALLERGMPARDEALADAERAFGYLQQDIRENGGGGAADERLGRVVDALLPGYLLSGRGTPTGRLRDAGRGLQRMAKAAGRWVGGREANIPCNEALLASAPRLLTAGQVESMLTGNERLDAEFREAIETRADPEAAAVAATLGVAGFYAWSQVDDTVLGALLASSPHSSRTLSDLKTLAEETSSSVGSTTRLSGYVAEQQAALDLSRAGHDVSFPEHPNQPGFDLLVDGQPVQVKCSLDADYVLEHFERYPDIPVIVNSELAGELGEHPLVFVDEHLSDAAVDTISSESLEALSEFADADDLLPIPLISVAFAAWRNYGDLAEGHIDGDTYVRRVGVDTASRTVGAGAGAVIAGAVASAFTGGLAAVAIAGLGGWLGSVAGSTGGDAINHPEKCDARDEAVAALGRFADWFTVELLDPREARLAARYKRMADWAQEARAAGFAPASVARMVAASREAMTRARDLSAWMRRHAVGDFDRAHAGWVAQREAPRFIHVELKPRLAKLREALRRHESAGKQSPAAVPALT